MRNKPPAFQFYAKDWRSSSIVRQMNLKERGVFIEMMAAAWDSEKPGTLPLPLEVVAKCVGLDPRVVRNFVSKYSKLWKEVGNRLVQPKLQAQWRELSAFSANARVRGKLGAEKRWGSHSSAKNQALPNDTSALAPASSSARQDSKPTPHFVLPSWIPQPAWDDFIEMRTKLRARPTEKAKALLVGQLEMLKNSGQDPRAVLEQSVERSWRGLFECAGTNVNKETATQQRDRQRRLEISVGTGPTTGPQSFCAHCGRTKAWHSRPLRNRLAEEPNFVEHAFTAKGSQLVSDGRTQILTMM